MFTTLPGAVGGAVSESVVLAVSVGAFPHMSLFGLWWCWMVSLCLVFVCMCVCACVCMCVCVCVHVCVCVCVCV